MQNEKAYNAHLNIITSASESFPWIVSFKHLYTVPDMLHLLKHHNKAIVTDKAIITYCLLSFNK